MTEINVIMAAIERRQAEADLRQSLAYSLIVTTFGLAVKRLCSRAEGEALINRVLARWAAVSKTALDGEIAASSDPLLEEMFDLPMAQADRIAIIDAIASEMKEWFYACLAATD